MWLLSGKSYGLRAVCKSATGPLSLLLMSCGPITATGRADALAEHYFSSEFASAGVDEKCDYASNVAQAYLTAGRGEQYSWWKHRAEVDCLRAELAAKVGAYR